ncbi:Butyrophilin subfamily 2 member A1, partial [Nibea albiflora]
VIISFVLFVCLFLRYRTQGMLSLAERVVPSSQTQRIEAEVHDNVTLQCDLDPRVNIENNTIVCDRVDLNKKVHAYRGKQDHPHEQMDQYRGRTTLNREDLSRGVLTLLISSVQTSDSGPYRCFVPKRKSSCTFNLTVDGAHMKAVHAGIITTAVIALCVLVVVLVVKRRTIRENRPTYQLIEAEVHDNVTLQCDLVSRVNIEKYTIVCERVDLNKKVHAYRGKQDHPHEQMDQYRGRTTLNREDLNRGVLTLLISSVQTSDSGPYRCFVPKTRKSSCTFNLTVDSAHMKAVRAGIITTAVIALCVLVVVLVVKRRTIQDCLKRLRVKKRTSNGSEERDEDQERPLKTVV